VTGLSVRRLVAVLLASVAATVVAGCALGSAPPFFVVQNDRPVAATVTYCAGTPCVRRETKELAPGASWRVTNTTGPHQLGMLIVKITGRRRRCAPSLPADTMVDRVFRIPVSSVTSGGCGGSFAIFSGGPIPGPAG
jgi:hypothetical protein